MSARDIFLAYGDYLWDLFCSPASGYVFAFAGAAFIAFFIFTVIYEYRHKRGDK